MMNNIFSKNPESYALFRPVYPDNLFDYIYSLCRAFSAVLDCGTGSGQAAIRLSEKFENVFAIDKSIEQIANSSKKKNIFYQVSNAEKIDFSNNTFDLVTVAQALHWFDFKSFWPEVNRVLKPNGIFAAWGYDWFSIDSKIDNLINKKIINKLRPYWSIKNEILWQGYKNIGMPFREISTPEFMIEYEVSPFQIVSYMKTWSASIRYSEKHGFSEFDDLEQELVLAWGNKPKTIKMKLHTLFGENHDRH